MSFALPYNSNAQWKKKKKKDVDNRQEETVKNTVQIEPVHPEDAFFLDLFKQYPKYFDSILANKKKNNVQIIYTRIDRDKNNRPEFKNFYFNRHSAKYYYPASTVKLPLVLLALQRLTELNIAGLDKYSTYITESAYSGQTPVYNEPNSPDGKPTIAQYIKQVLMVSDNNAANRLYEMMGQKYVNDELQRKGYKSAQILHRLDVYLTEDENRHTNPIKFYDLQNKLVYAQPMLFNKDMFEKRKDSIGVAYYSNGKLINKPMSFSSKNRLDLEDLHDILKSVVFPASVVPAKRFNITEADRNFVLKYMSQLPGESIFPYYDTSYYSAYCKFLLYGAERGALPPNVRIFNKVGDAYGHLIDAAYIVDFDKGVEFMLSAIIYCNSDGVLNDDKYDYESVGFPFMKNLGKVIYDMEVKRKKNFRPDLSEFKFTYDK